MKLLRIENLALDGLFQQLADGINAAFDKIFTCIHHNDVNAFLGNFLRDTAAHIACTDNCDFIYL